MSEHKPLSRKSFVIAGAGTVAAVAAAAADPNLADAAEQIAASAPHTAKSPLNAAPLPALGARPEAYAYFTAPEVAFVEAAVERLIPTDGLHRILSM